MVSEHSLDDSNALEERGFKLLAELQHDRMLVASHRSKAGMKLTYLLPVPEQHALQTETGRLTRSVQSQLVAKPVQQFLFFQQFHNHLAELGKFGLSSGRYSC